MAPLDPGGGIGGLGDRRAPALVSEAEFVAAQQVRAARPTREGQQRSYRLAGLVVCAVCQRRLDSHWVHGRAAYRCRHGSSSARPRPADGPKYVYVREDILLRQLISRFTTETGLASQNDVSPGGIASVVAKLRSAEAVIVHDGIGWSLRANS